MKEKWVPVFGFEGIYEVNEFGVIRSLDIKRNSRLSKSKIISQSLLPTGYMRVSLMDFKGVRKTCLVHRVVLESFEGKKENFVVNHIDCNKTNNHLSNLEWVTQQENINHAKENNLMPKGENHVHSKMTNKEVEWIKENYRKGCKEFGVRALARKFNVSKTTMDYLVKNKTWKHITQLSKQQASDLITRLEDGNKKIEVTQ